MHRLEFDSLERGARPWFAAKGGNIRAGSLVHHGSGAALIQGDVEAKYRRRRNATLGGGSGEVMREMVARLGLGLPKGVR